MTTNFQDCLAEVNRVYTSKGKAVSKTAITKLDIIKRAEVRPTEQNIKSAEKAWAFLQEILLDVESSKPAKMSVHVSGESVLSAETITNRAGSYVLTLRDIARLEQDTERRLAELRTKLQNIEAKIPHAQNAEFNAEVTAIQVAFQDSPL